MVPQAPRVGGKHGSRPWWPTAAGGLLTLAVLAAGSPAADDSGPKPEKPGRTFGDLGPEQVGRMLEDMRRAERAMRWAWEQAEGWTPPLGAEPPFAWHPTPAPSGAFSWSAGGARAVSWSRTDDRFTARYTDGALAITLTGAVADGKARVREIRVRDRDTVVDYDSLDQVPGRYRDRVNGLIELTQSDPFVQRPRDP
jgi:hypothetical protein